MKSDDGEGDVIGKGRIDFVKSLNELEIGKDENVDCDHKKTDLAIVFFTSGTTSNPKLVLLEAEYSKFFHLPFFFPEQVCRVCTD